MPPNGRNLNEGVTKLREATEFFEDAVLQLCNNKGSGTVSILVKISYGQIDYARPKLERECHGSAAPKKK